MDFVTAGDRLVEHFLSKSWVLRCSGSVRSTGKREDHGRSGDSDEFIT